MHVTAKDAPQTTLARVSCVQLSMLQRNTWTGERANTGPCRRVVVPAPTCLLDARPQCCGVVHFQVADHLLGQQRLQQQLVAAPVGCRPLAEFRRTAWGGGGCGVEGSTTCRGTHGHGVVVQAGHVEGADKAGTQCHRETAPILRTQAAQHARCARSSRLTRPRPRPCPRPPTSPPALLSPPRPPRSTRPTHHDTIAVNSSSEMTTASTTTAASRPPYQSGSQPFAGATRTTHCAERTGQDRAGQDRARMQSAVQAEW